MHLGYVARRLGLFLLVVWLSITLNFFLLRVPQMGSALTQMQRALHGEAVEGTQRKAGFLQERLSLDRPLWEQYWRYLGDTCRLDLGYSMYLYPKTVREIVADALPGRWGCSA